jgi:hypothetical protein
MSFMLQNITLSDLRHQEEALSSYSFSLFLLSFSIFSVICYYSSFFLSLFLSLVLVNFHIIKSHHHVYLYLLSFSLFVFCRLFMCFTKGYSSPWETVCLTKLPLFLCQHLSLGNISKSERYVTFYLSMYIHICKNVRFMIVICSFGLPKR